ncbi:beta-galactosidase [Vibrio sp. WXL103]|uniref:beta-galactosidase n=1 Tax=Vibrio sp. WXL103 TaxID=3450710 RepID=UPI003EC78C6F
MKPRKTQVAVLLSSIMFCSINFALANTTTDVTSELGVVTNQDAQLDGFFERATVNHATLSKVSGSYQVDFEAVSEQDKARRWPNVKVTPENGTWNWNDRGSLKLTLSNPLERPADVVIKLSDRAGLMGASSNQLNYAVTVPAGQSTEVDLQFNGSQRKLNGYWGGQKLDLRQLAEFAVIVQGPKDAQTILIDNLELTAAAGDFVSATEQVVIAKEPIETLLDVMSFDQGPIKNVRPVGSELKLVEQGDGYGLEIRYSADEEYPSVTFREAQPWDWSEVGDFNLALEIANPLTEPVQLNIRVDQAEEAYKGGTANGFIDSMTNYITLPAESTNTYYMPLSILTGHVDSGIGSEPPRLSYNAQPISRGWGLDELDTSSIYAVKLYLQNPSKDRTIIVNNIRLIPNIDANLSRYKGMVDQYGQFTGYDWRGKVHSDEQLRAKGAETLASMEKSTSFDDRSKFGGWADGPKLEATGFFRTEKVDGKWALVDPEGYLFFITGLANIRNVDMGTITGVDFDNHVTREGRTIASDLRHSMFSWLPDYDSPYAQAYGYARGVHKGAIKNGETFSFYISNLMRKYQTDSADEAMDIWREVTLERMREWGFTTLGNWIGDDFIGTEKVAYQAHGWIRGDHARISSGNDYWGALHDPFDPEFIVSTKQMAQDVASKVDVNDPWLLGVFVDNEASWGNPNNQANHYGLIINALSYDASESPAKAAFVEHLKSKYPTVDELNQHWGTQISSWEDFARSFEYRTALSAGMEHDYAEMKVMLSEQYFSIVRQEIKRVLPNHMYLGARFAPWGVTEEVLRGAAPYVDVMSHNLYSNDLNSPKAHWRPLLEEFDLPTMIGEFHFGATDSGLFHGGIITVTDQAERAKMYAHYMQSIVDDPYMVGAHWFQYLDSPATGRSWDGANFNVGFVSIADEPYQELVESARNFNQRLYTNRFGQ